MNIPPNRSKLSRELKIISALSVLAIYSTISPFHVSQRWTPTQYINPNYGYEND